MVKNNIFFNCLFVCLFVITNNNIYHVNAAAACGEFRCVKKDAYNQCGVACSTTDCGTTTACTNFLNAGTASASCNDANSACANANVAKDLNNAEDPCCSSNPCFSSKSTADVLNKGITLVKDLQVGDYVLTGSNEYKKIYTIDHIDPDIESKFLQIYYNNDETSPLELTETHLIFVHGKNDPIPAKHVHVGDQLLTPNNSNNVNERQQQEPLIVTKISEIQRTGLWNPITEDGTIVVNGIVTSTYNTQPIDAHYNYNIHDDVGPYIEINGYKIISQHDFIHLIMGPYRFMCMSSFSSKSVCEISNDNNEVFNYYNKLGKEILKIGKKQNPIVQNVIIFTILISSVLFYFIMNPIGITMILSSVGVAYFVIMKNKKEIK